MATKGIIEQGSTNRGKNPVIVSEVTDPSKFSTQQAVTYVVVCTHGDGDFHLCEGCEEMTQCYRGLVQ